MIMYAQQMKLLWLYSIENSIHTRSKNKAFFVLIKCIAQGLFH